MPLWNVYCTEGTNSSEEKRAFADAIPCTPSGKALKHVLRETVLG